jgi:APA family basic amino acid/polyamine antiporter
VAAERDGGGRHRHADLLQEATLALTAGAATELRRGLTLIHATALVVGTMVGTGIYLRPALMAQQVGSAPLVLLAWLAAGLLSVAGALIYAELSARLPHTGGEYVFLRQTFGPFTAFLFGWTRTIVGAASQAAVAVAIGIFLAALVPALAPWKHVVAALAVAILTAINCAGVVAGARTQTALTITKVAVLVALIGLTLLLAPEISPARLAGESGPGGTTVSAFGAAMVGALWPYAGWNNLPMTAGETIAPTRTMPRAIVGGALGVTALYLCVNAVYFMALPFEEVASSNSVIYPNAPAVGVKVAQSFLGPAGSSVLFAAFAISAFGTLNGMLLSTARVGFAMARDGLLPAVWGRIGDRSRAPTGAILVLGGLTVALALAGTIDRLATSAIIGYWVFHALCGLALFRLRRDDVSGAAAGFRMPWYPFVPVVFVACGAWLVVNSIHAMPVESRWALGTIASGVPAYLLLAHGARGAVR